MVHSYHIFISHKISSPSSALYILFGAQNVFSAKKTLLFCYAIYPIPKHSNKLHLGHIFTKSFRSFTNIVMGLILNFLYFKNIYF